MQVPFAILAEVLQGIARRERSRVQFVTELMARGRIEPTPGESLAGWRSELAHLDEAIAVLQILGAQEPAARSLDPRLARPLLCKAGEPTMWPPAADPPASTSGGPSGP